MRSRSALAEELLKLPLRPSAAMRVLWALDDGETSAAALARLIEVDPALSSRVMQVANTPYYGLHRRVTSAAQAVMIIGFTMVRALAVGAAAGLFVHRKRAVPRGFWAHAAAAAVGASIVAEHTDADVSDAFSAGLLHDLGVALLFRHLDDGYQTLILSATATERPLPEVEAEVFGFTHAWAAAAVLEEWRFPPGFVRAIGGHHDDPAAADPLGAAVIAGDALAVAWEPTGAHGGELAAAEALAAAGLDPESLAAVLGRMGVELQALASLLSW